ncbi:MAG: DUF1934 domain-containing protein [Streptococcus sp.]|nr:DUF1934 domain-containing protein [Streptococcus sp.]
MEVTIKNIIKIDDEMEEIVEVYPCEVFLKESHFYLRYTNSEEEKVVLKIGLDEFVMTRFSNPKSVMHFNKNQITEVSIPTPIGYQYFQISCEIFEFDSNENCLKITYSLSQRNLDQVFAYYNLELFWK